MTKLGSAKVYEDFYLVLIILKKCGKLDSALTKGEREKNDLRPR